MAPAPPDRSVYSAPHPGEAAAASGKIRLDGASRETMERAATVAVRQAERRRHMSKRKSAKYKLDRRMGANIWSRPKSSVNRRSYGPGQHGQRRSEEHTSELQSLMR